MIEQLDNFYLGSCLEPLAPYLARHDITDIYINRPGEIWIETLGRVPVKLGAPDLTRQLLTRLARQIAAVSAQGINRENPLLAASLPTGERVQIAMPPATRGDIAFAIRKHVSTTLSLDDYNLADLKVRPATSSADEHTNFNNIDVARDPIAILRHAVHSRQNILISGGTSSGKTTFLNALLQEIPEYERIVSIEDTPELKFGHENVVGLLAARGNLNEADITTDDLLIASLRMRPDRIILGEIRGKEAVTFLRAINTGHPGSISTIHANSPSRAIDQLALLVLQTGSRMAWDDVIRYVRRSVDIIVQLRRVAGHREISEISIINQHI